jgi:hypothetical protein
MDSDEMTARWWLALFLLGAVLNILVGLADWPAVLTGHLQDPDSYMRLERILQGIAKGHLVNRVARDDSGAGVMLEWSRLLDMVLWLMAAPLAVFTGWRQALFTAGVALGPLGVGCAGLALAYAARPFAQTKYLWAAPVAAALLPGLQAFAAPGVVHYHMLLLALIALTAGLAARSWQGDSGWAFLTGLAGGAAIWLTPETMPFILMIYAALLLRWVERPIGGALAACAAGFAGILIFALAIDPPEGGYFAPEADRLSIVYVALGLLLLAGTLALQRLQSWPPLRRRGCGVLLMAALMLGWIAWFPKVAMGPYGLMDAADRQMFFGVILETQPARTLADFTGFLFPGLLALLYLGWRAGGAFAWLWAYACLCGFVALLLGVKFLLFVEFSAGLAAALLPMMLSHAGIRFKSRPAAATAVRLFLLTLFLLVPRLPLGAHAEARPAPVCDLRHIDIMLAPYAGEVVLADVRDTPELLYRTQIVTVGSLYQHGVPGFLRARAAWRSIPGSAPPAPLIATQARYILFCPIQGRYDLVADLPPRTLWDALQNNQPPGWLKPRASTPEGWKLYKIQ